MRTYLLHSAWGLMWHHYEDQRSTTGAWLEASSRRYARDTSREQENARSAWHIYSLHPSRRNINSNEPSTGISPTHPSLVSPLRSCVRMQPKIYASTFPSVPIVNRSIFTHLFTANPSNPTTVGGYPGSDPAFIDATTGTTLSRSQLKHLALSFGYGLLHHPSLPPMKRGDTVLVYSPNSLAWPVVVFGCVAAGLRCSPANSGYTSRELGYQYTDSGAKVVLTSQEGLEIVKEMLKDLGEDGKRKIVVLGSGLGWAGGPDDADSKTEGFLKLEDLLAMGTLAEEAKFTGNQVHETIYICYSSGTTGKAKGVEVSLYGNRLIYVLRCSLLLRLLIITSLPCLISLDLYFRWCTV